MNQTIAALVRRHDPDRFLTALFAPPDKRDALLTLYAFNHELARAREVASAAAAGADPAAMVARGGRRRPTAARGRRTAAAAIDEGELDRDDLLALIDAREIEAEPASRRWPAWRDYLLAKRRWVGRRGRPPAAGAPEPEAVPPLGRGLWRGRRPAQRRALPARSGRLLPVEVLARARVDAGSTSSRTRTPSRTVLRLLAGDGSRPGLRVAAPRAPARDCRCAACRACAPRSPRVRRRPQQRGLGDRLAVIDRRPIRPHLTASRSSISSRGRCNGSNSAAPNAANLPPAARDAMRAATRQQRRGQCRRAACASSTGTASQPSSVA